MKKLLLLLAGLIFVTGNIWAMAPAAPVLPSPSPTPVIPPPPSPIPSPTPTSFCPSGKVKIQTAHIFGYGQGNNEEESSGNAFEKYFYMMSQFQKACQLWGGSSYFDPAGETRVIRNLSAHFSINADCCRNVTSMLPLPLYSTYRLDSCNSNLGDNFENALNTQGSTLLTLTSGQLSQLPPSTSQYQNEHLYFWGGPNVKETTAPFLPVVKSMAEANCAAIEPGRTFLHFPQSGYIDPYADDFGTSDARIRLHTNWACCQGRYTPILRGRPIDMSNPIDVRRGCNGHSEPSNPTGPGYCL